MAMYWFWGPGKGTFDRSRNAEKRNPVTARQALIERMARRRLASWRREMRNLDMKCAVLGGA